MIKEILLVGAGSMIGGISRYLVSCGLKGVSADYPWATFAVNIAGCLAIGFLWGFLNKFPNVSAQLTLFLSVGFCGGFTTFSTFSKESLMLMQNGNYTMFALYAIGSVALGIIAVAAGFMIAK